MDSFIKFFFQGSKSEKQIGKYHFPSSPEFNSEGSGKCL